MIWVFLLNLVILLFFFLINHLLSIEVLTTPNVISVITVMLVSMSVYGTISIALNKNKTLLILVALGLKFLLFLAYLFIMILFYEITDIKMFVFTFMLIYMLGAAQLVYLLQKKLKTK